MPDRNVDFNRMQNRLAQGGSEGGSAAVVLDTSFVSAQTGADTNETDLWTFSLPANTLSYDGCSLRITAFGTVAANGNAKTIRLYFGGTVLQILSAGTQNNVSWQFLGTVHRTAAATQLGSTNFNIAATFTNHVMAAPTETLSGAVTIKVTGQNGSASAGDIVFRGAMVELLN